MKIQMLHTFLIYDIDKVYSCHQHDMNVAQFYMMDIQDYFVSAKRLFGSCKSTIL